MNRDSLGDSAFFDFYAQGKSDDDVLGLYAESLKPAYLFVANNPVNAIDPFGLVILLEAHPALPPLSYNHSKITIIPDCQATWAMDNRFAANTTPGGQFYATLGAGPDNGWWTNNPLLIGGVNRPRDVNRGHNTFSTVLTPPAGMSEDDFIIALFAADSRYGDNLGYSFSPSHGLNRYNSNSYASGLLRSLLGGGIPQPPNAPGFNTPVPAHHFR